MYVYPLRDMTSSFADQTRTCLQLGRGVVAFIRATLGFEQDIMRQGGLTVQIAVNCSQGVVGY
jgi:hypothetical protein